MHAVLVLLSKHDMSFKNVTSLPKYQKFDDCHAAACNHYSDGSSLLYSYKCISLNLRTIPFTHETMSFNLQTIYIYIAKYQIFITHISKPYQLVMNQITQSLIYHLWYKRRRDLTYSNATGNHLQFRLKRGHISGSIYRIHPASKQRLNQKWPNKSMLQ